MSQGLILPRGFLVYGLTLPLAVFIGYLLATPYTTQSFLGISGIFMLLCSPILIRWHHPILILSWNALVVLYFLPGQVSFGALVTLISFGVALISRALNKQMRFVYVPQLVIPLVFLSVVIVATAKYNGFGLRMLGSGAFGGKNYFLLGTAILGYFALTAIPIAAHRAQRYASMFFLSGLTAVVGNLAYVAGPAFYYLLFIFPNNASWMTEGEVRYGGFGMASVAGYFFLLQRYGLQGIFNLNRPWRLIFFVTLIVGCIMGSFRSHLIMIFVITAFQFYYEGLHRTRFLPGAVLGVVLGFVLLFAFARELPLTAQRTLSFLPIPVDRIAKYDAEASTRWRIDMWTALLPDVQKYWLIGKGYTINPTDLYLAEESALRGFTRNYEHSMVAGDYHNGILSLIIPFGILGVLGFAWFCVAAIKVLHRNYRHGPERLKKINTFLLSFFVGKLVFYLTLYGAFNYDFWLFIGIVGFSVALNHGVARAPEQVAPAPAEDQPSRLLMPAPAAVTGLR